MGRKGSQSPPAKAKGAKAPRVIDPFDRPEGSIVDQTARFYVWYDSKGWHLRATAKGQHPLAVVLSCIDSRTPAELIFDLGMGDIFSIRIAGNITSRKVLASAEYGCAVAGAKLILVIGHTRCGAVTARWFPEFDQRRAVAARVAAHAKATFVPLQAIFDRKVRSSPPEYWAADGVHPTPAGHAVIANAWRRVAHV